MATSLTQMYSYLEKERDANGRGNWTKLGRLAKKEKMATYAKTLLTNNSCLLTDYLQQCVDNGQLTTANELQYDAEKGIIVAIPALIIVGEGKFTLKSKKASK